MSEFYFIAAYFSQQLESINRENASAANILMNLKMNALDAMEELSVRQLGVSKSGFLSMLESNLCSFPPDRSVNAFLQNRFDFLDPDTRDSFLDVECFEILINGIAEDYQDLFNCPLANVNCIDVLKKSSSLDATSITDFNLIGSACSSGGLRHTNSDLVLHRREVQ